MTMTEIEKYQRRLLLFGWLPQAAAADFVDRQCVDSERARKAEILQRWTRAHEAFNAKPPRAFESVSLSPIAAGYADRLKAIAADRRFCHTFTQMPTEFMVVEIDKLIACQTTVILDYVDRLVAELPIQPSMDDLVDICLSLDKTVPGVSEMRLADNAIIYSSENTDLRFLGAIPKPLGEVDLGASSTGGIPTRGLLLLFGYGGSPISVIEVGRRVFLNNGFHRAVALRRRGVTHIPVVVQKVRNPALEFPDAYQGVPKNYLLNSEVLPLMEDYFNPEMAIELKAKARRRGVKVVWMTEAIDVPL